MHIKWDLQQGFAFPCSTAPAPLAKVGINSIDNVHIMQPHGHFSMERTGNRLVCRPSGPFNLAGAEAYEALFLASVQPLLAVRQPWGSSR